MEVQSWSIEWASLIMMRIPIPCLQRELTDLLPGSPMIIFQDLRLGI